MATILSLVRYDQQPAVRRNGNNITASEVWCLTTAARVLPLEADGALYSLGLRNPYGFPAIQGTPHPTTTGVLSLGYSTMREDQAQVGYVFKVTVNYSNSNRVTAASKDPTDAAPLYRSENVLVEEETDIDQVSGDPIVNSLGYLFFPKQIRTRTLKRWIITRNERKYDDIRSQETVNKLNDDNLSINGRAYPRLSCLLESWEAEPKFDPDGRQYFVHTYKILIDLEKFHAIELIDVGVEKDINGNPPPGRDPGKTITQPAFLDGNGSYLPLDKQKAPKAADLAVLIFYLNPATPMSFLKFSGAQYIGTDLGKIPRTLGQRTDFGTIPRRLG